MLGLINNILQSYQPCNRDEHDGLTEEFLPGMAWRMSDRGMAQGLVWPHQIAQWHCKDYGCGVTCIVINLFGAISAMF